MDLPSFHNYMGNGRDNALCFHIGSIDVYFSYKTPVAFSAPGQMVVRENDWGPTTGKHLNAIDDGDKKNRVSGGEFEARLRSAMAIAKI